MVYFFFPAKVDSTSIEPVSICTTLSPPKYFYLRAPLPGLALRTPFCHPHYIAIVFNLPVLFSDDHLDRDSIKGVYSACKATAVVLMRSTYAVHNPMSYVNLYVHLRQSAATKGGNFHERLEN